jgi:hypothetical protein
MAENHSLPGWSWAFALVLAALCAQRAVAEAGSTAQPALRPQVESRVGIEGVYFLRNASAGIVAKPVDERSPLVLRVASAVRDGDSYLYEIRYIGTVPGRYDLREYLLRPDAQPLQQETPLVVAIQATLPDDHDGGLDTFRHTPRPAVWPYRAVALGAIAVWLFVTTVLVLRRWLQRKRVSPADVAPPPNLADQLRPLVERAIRGELTAAGQARLEMLLLGHWRRLLQLEKASPQEALSRMRAHAEAGKLLRSLEAWLHRPPSAHRVDVAALLAPYRHAAPQPLGEPGREAVSA